MSKNKMMDKSDVKTLLLYLLKYVNKICEDAGIPYYASAGTCLGAVRHKGLIPWDDDIDIMIPRKYYDLFVEKCSQILKSPVVIRTRENDPTFCCEYIKLCFKDDALGYSDLSIDVFFLDETNPKRKFFRIIQNRILIDLYFIKKYKLSKVKLDETYIPKNILKRIYISALSFFLSFKNIEKIHKKTMLAEKKADDYWINWGSCYSYKKATYLKKTFGTPRKLEYENTYIYAPQKPEIMLTQLYGKNYMTPPPPEKRTDHGIRKLNCKELDIESIRKEIGL